MFRLTLIFSTLVVLSVATDFKKCSDNRPAPKAIRIAGCEKMPCDVIKGSDSITEVDFSPDHDVKTLTTKVKATALGITIPHQLPEELRNVCKNLVNGAYCPMDADEDAVYKLVVPIASFYPEVPVTLEISLVDEADTVVACFISDIKVKKQ